MSNPQQAPSAPPPPTPPSPVQITTGPGGVTIGTPGAPSADVPARGVLEARRSELSRQLNSATDRRNELVEQLAGAEGVARTGLEARITQLDGRILDLETQIAENGRLLTATATSRTQASIAVPPPGGRSVNFDGTPIAIVATLFVFAPIALAFAWRMLKRPTAPPSTVSPEMRDRLERIEQAVEAIAIEVERVSEGQRFVTRVLHEQRQPALGAGPQPMEAVRVAQGEAAKVGR
jgi:hypothetical protein